MAGYIFTEVNFLHTDRPSSEWAVTCCLEKHKEWPISFDKDGEVTTIDLDVGDICIYKGIEYPTGEKFLMVLDMCKQC